MKPFSSEVTTHAIRRLAECRAAAGLPRLEAMDAVWVCHAVVNIVQPVRLPATAEQLAAWFADWLPAIEAQLERLSDSGQHQAYDYE